MNVTTESGSTSWRRVGVGGTLVASGLLAGGLIAGTLSANAASAGPVDGNSSITIGTASDTSPPSDETPPAESDDQSQPQRSDETLLTGETADRVTEAALAEYPGATVLRVETDSDGAYEAHLITADGERVTVEVDENFNVSGTEQCPGGMGKGPRGGGGRGPELSGDGETDGSTSNSSFNTAA
jgi:hypothetical protein